MEDQVNLNDLLPQLQPQPVQLSNAQFQSLISGQRAPSVHRKVDSFDSGDPSEWLIWRDRFAAIARVTEWTAERQRAEIKIAMTGVAAAAVQDISEHSGETVKDLLDAFEKRFLPPTASDAAWSTYCAAQQTEAESLQMWHTRLRGLFRRAYPEMDTASMETHRDLIQRFVSGLSGATLRGHTRRMTFTTYSEALAAAQKAEASECDSHRRGGGARRVFALEPQEHQVDAVNPTAAAVQCWECLRTGHVRRDCPSSKFRAGSSYPVGSQQGRGGSLRPRPRGPSRPTRPTPTSSRYLRRRPIAGSKRRMGRAGVRRALHHLSQQVAALEEDIEGESDSEEEEEDVQEEVGAYAEGYGDGLEDGQASETTEEKTTTN